MWFCSFLLLFLRLHPSLLYWAYFCPSTMPYMLSLPSALNGVHATMCNTQDRSWVHPIMWDARRCWPSPISARASAKVGSTPALQLPLPGMDSNQRALMICTCLSLLICSEDIGLHLRSACPRGPRSPCGTSGCYCTQVTGHAFCLLPLAATQKGGTQLWGGAGLLGECWRQTSQNNKALQTLFLQPTMQSSKNSLALPMA